MGRRPAQRVSYSDDSRFMLRLADAIDRDERLPAKWKAEVMGRLRQMGIDLLNAPVD